MSDLEAQLAALADLPVDGLIDQHVELYGRPPRSRNRANILRRIAWRLQEQRLGGLSGAARKRLDELMSEIDFQPATNRSVTGRVRSPHAPQPGTVLTRRWKGKEIEVLVTDSGFEWDGETYRSLSAVARAITGTRWNGRVFFGLSKRKRAKTRR